MIIMTYYYIYYGLSLSTPQLLSTFRYLPDRLDQESVLTTLVDPIIRMREVLMNVGSLLVEARCRAICVQFQQLQRQEY